MVDPDSHNKGYWEMGHSLDSDVEIWIWDKGKLFTKKSGEEERELFLTHGFFEDELRRSHRLENQIDMYEGIPQRRYYGRFEKKNGNKRVTIRPSFRNMGRISPQLIRDLQTEYGNDIEIYTFD